MMSKKTWRKFSKSRNLFMKRSSQLAVELKRILEFESSLLQNDSQYFNLHVKSSYVSAIKWKFH